MPNVTTVYYFNSHYKKAIIIHHFAQLKEQQLKKSACVKNNYLEQNTFKRPYRIFQGFFYLRK